MRKVSYNPLVESYHYVMMSSVSVLDCDAEELARFMSYLTMARLYPLSSPMWNHVIDAFPFQPACLLYKDLAAAQLRTLESPPMFKYVSRYALEDFVNNTCRELSCDDTHESKIAIYGAALILESIPEESLSHHGVLQVESARRALWQRCTTHLLDAALYAVRLHHFARPILPKALLNHFAAFAPDAMLSWLLNNGEAFIRHCGLQLWGALTDTAITNLSRPFTWSSIATATSGLTRAAAMLKAMEQDEVGFDATHAIREIAALPLADQLMVVIDGTRHRTYHLCYAWLDVNFRNAHTLCPAAYHRHSISALMRALACQERWSTDEVAQVCTHLALVSPRARMALYDLFNSGPQEICMQQFLAKALLRANSLLLDSSDRTVLDNLDYWDTRIQQMIKDNILRAAACEQIATWRKAYIAFVTIHQRLTTWITQVVTSKLTLLLRNAQSERKAADVLVSALHEEDITSCAMKIIEEVLGITNPAFVVA